jgi:LacI family transcriptional regulator
MPLNVGEPGKTKISLLKSHLLKEMADQRIPAGGQLPPESELGRRFSVSRTTVRQALMELSNEGFVERRHGRGTFRIAQTMHPRWVQGRSMLVGVWFNWVAPQMYGPVSEGIREELDERGYHAVFERGSSETEEDRGINSLIRKGMDGFIVSPSEHPGDRHEPLIRVVERKVPLVFVDRMVPGCGYYPADLVCTHSEMGTVAVVTHLIQLGHRRIGFVGTPDLATMEDRLRAYRTTMRKHGLAVDEAWVVFSQQTATKEGQEAAAATLLALPAGLRPTAVFGGNDWLAVAIADVARDRGLRIPQDLSIAGFDDIHVHIGSGDPEWLTTYAQPLYQIGQLAARLLLERIEQPDQPARRVLLQGTLIERASTAPPGQ